MSEIEITDELVEVGALAAFNAVRARHGWPPLDAISDSFKLADQWSDEARAILSAVAPLIAAQEREQTDRFAADFKKVIDTGPPDRICEQCRAPMFHDEGWTDPEGVSGCIPMMTEGKQQGPCFAYRARAENKEV